MYSNRVKCFIMQTTIEAINLTKYYGATCAVRELNFSINSGEVVGFLGPNGAGKSTTMKLLTGFMAPSSGHLTIAGFNPLTQRLQAQHKIGYLPEHVPLYDEMTISEYLYFIGCMRNMGRSALVFAQDKYLEICGLSERRTQIIGELSKGYRQRVGLAQALLNDPSILILDEPTTGLDPNQILDLRELIKELGQRRTVLLSTHILSEVEATCSRVLIIDNGTLSADGPVDELLDEAQGGRTLWVSFGPGGVKLTSEQLLDRLQKLNFVSRARFRFSENEIHSFELLVTGDPRGDIFAFAVEQQLTLLELSVAQSDLEAVFRQLTNTPQSSIKTPNPATAE